MKSERKIRKRVNQLLYRAFQKRARKELTRSPQNCVFNHSTALRYTDESPFRVCGLRLGDGDVVPCNTNDTVSECSAFTCRTTRSELMEKVRKEALSSDTGPSKYPSVFSLWWVLDESPLGSEGPGMLRKLVLRLFSRGREQ